MTDKPPEGPQDEPPERPPYAPYPSLWNPDRPMPVSVELPRNKEGKRIFTSTPGPAHDNFQRETLDIIRQEREEAKWKPNPIDLPPDVDPSTLDPSQVVNEEWNESLDAAPLRKAQFRSHVDKGHHPEWTDARRIQQEGYWGPHTKSIAASRASIANIEEFEDTSSLGSAYDPGHPWDPHHDQHYARPQLHFLPKTQWKQNVQKLALHYNNDKAPLAYWRPDLWDPEYERQGRWVYPDQEPLEQSKAWEIKKIPIGLTDSEINARIKPLTHDNMLYWMDHLDRLDPAKNTKGIDFSLKNADRRVLSWRDQFNPPDNTEIEWMENYDEDSRMQWEDYLTIHPSEWKTAYQSGNTLAPATDGRGMVQMKADPLESVSPMEVATLEQKAETSLEQEGMSGIQKTALTVGGVGLLAAGAVGLYKAAQWAWDKFGTAVGEDNDSEEENAEKSKVGTKVKRSHARDWMRSINSNTQAVWE